VQQNLHINLQYLTTVFTVATIHAFANCPYEKFIIQWKTRLYA